MENEIRKEFIDQQNERELLARTGRSRPVSRTGLPSEAEVRAKSGPVVIYQKAKNQTLRANLNFLKDQEHLTWAEVSKKAGCALSTIMRAAAGETVSRHTIRSIANGFGVTPEYLTGSSAKQPTSSSTPKAEDTPAAPQSGQKRFVFSLSANGVYTGCEIAQLLGSLIPDMRYSLCCNVSAEAEP